MILAIVYSICHRLGESPFGRVLKGIRDDDQATLSLGKNVVFYKVLVFGITCGPPASPAGSLLDSTASRRRASSASTSRWRSSPW
ncbi:MAG: hypothetical protein R2705_06140 [Ilumatobacteraceae bacterium]